MTKQRKTKKLEYQTPKTEMENEEEESKSRKERLTSHKGKKHFKVPP